MYQNYGMMMRLHAKTLSMGDADYGIDNLCESLLLNKFVFVLNNLCEFYAFPVRIIRILCSY